MDLPKDVGELTRLFSDLREKSLKRGETVDSVRCEFLRQVGQPKSAKRHTGRFFGIALLPVILAAAYYCDVFELIKVRESPCLVNFNEIFIEVARKPSNCSTLCEGLTEIPRLSKLSEEEFVEQYGYSGRPLVVTDAAKNWSALELFNFTFFKRLFQENKDAYKINEDECQFFPYNTDFISLEQAFNMSKERSEWKERPWYFGW